VVAPQGARERMVRKRASTPDGSSRISAASQSRPSPQELAHAGVLHTFRIYHGGHQRSLWQSQAPHWLDLALAYMAQ